MKAHLHDEQFDGHLHARCGRGDRVLTERAFEAADPNARCRVCERDHFQNGQPGWHRRAAVRAISAPGAPD